MDGILKKSTIGSLRAGLSQKGVGIVYAWAQSDPKQVREWEADGTLLDRAKEAQNRANEVLEMARQDRMTHLAAHEIYELYGGPNLRL